MAQQKEYEGFVIDVDMSGVETWDGQDRPLVPIGTYRFKVVNLINHGPRIEGVFEILDGEHAGSKVWNNYQHTNDTGKKRLKNLMVACGASLGRFDSDELVGSTIIADVVHNLGQAKPDEMGNVREPKTFANLCNERQADVEEPAAGAAADPEPPPVTRETQPAAKPANKTRRA
jgi:hypothetical protein